jgi:excisionase family DNA binding protein
MAQRSELPTLMAELERAKAAAWARLSQPKMVKASAELIDAEEMARRTGLSKFGILDRARRKAIPAVRIGRLVRFDPDQVIAALRSNGESQDNAS